MAEMKYTPGPWQFNEENGRIADQKNDPVAYISGRARQFGKERLTTPSFNGRLIAAAPELLEALEALLDISPVATNGGDKEIHRRAEAAIRKAKGE
jgi:hypothetical protein